MKLSDIGEFGLIHRFSPPFLEGLAEGVRGIGDDCSVVEQADGSLQLVTTDMLVEDVHFRRAAIGAFDLGRKSLAVNLSDIAAMGGTPTSAYLSLGIPREVEVEWLDRFFEGLRALCAEAGVDLLGGDTTGSPGPLIVNLAVLGAVSREGLKLRRDARVGDVVCVTGWLGDSAAGLHVLLNDLPVEGDSATLLERHHRPRAHFAEGAWLGRRAEVHAMIDVSDGLDSDGRHVMESSGCGLELDLEGLPLSPELRRWAEREGRDAAAVAAGGGEDYCLLLTADAKDFDRLAAEYHAEFGRDLHQIGRAIEGDRLRWQRDGEELSLDGKSWDHFARE